MIVLPNLDLEIRTCPKVLSTSLKLWAFRLENDRDFVPFSVKGNSWTVHRLYPTRPFTKQQPSGMSVRVCFVRDPVERLTSAYVNRVLRKHPAEQHQFAALQRYGLSDEPSLATFIDHLEAYRNHVPTLEHHTAAQVTYLGGDASYYTHIFGMHEIAKFEHLAATLTGIDFVLPHEQRASNSLDALSWRYRRKVKRLFREDYASYGRFMR